MKLKKICRGCGKELPIEEFYKHPQMMDGHLNYCKECVKNRVARHREENIESIREYDRKRGHRENRKKLRYEITRKRRREVNGYQKAHSTIKRAVESGEIERSNMCQICGLVCKTEGHHMDYDKPKQVIWLCAQCHRQLHMGKTKRAKIVQRIANDMKTLRA